MLSLATGAIAIPRSVAGRPSIPALLGAEAHSIALSPNPFREFRRLRSVIELAYADARKRFVERGSAEELHAARAHLADDALSGVLRIARHKSIGDLDSASAPIAAVATGGFGRRQLAPASDLDVLFFLPEQAKERERAEEMLAFAIPALWDLGFSLDHLSLRQSDCRELGASDSKLLSSILDARLVWGSQALYRQFLDTRDALLAGRTRAMLRCRLTAESAQRHAREGSQAMTEPDVKYSSGALRDIQCLRWLERLRPGDQSAGACEPCTVPQVAAAESFLCRVRCHLHLLTGRAENRLRHDLQVAVACRMGLSAERDAAGGKRLLSLVRDCTSAVRNQLTVD